MHAAVMHEAGNRIDAEDVVELTRRSRLMYDAGMTPPRYALLQLCATAEEAARVASDMRKARRARMAAGDMGRG